MKRIAPVFFVVCFITQLYSRPLLETEGAFSVNTYKGNVLVAMTEKVGFNLTPNINISVSGEQLYRNRSFVNSLFSGVEYRFGSGDKQIPLGTFVGIHNIHIGHYSSFTPVAGINTGMIIWLNNRASLRVNFLNKLYFDSHTIFGNDIFVGYSFAFL